MGDQKTYHENFIEGVNRLAADQVGISLKAKADMLGMPPMSLYKIMDGSHKPTVEQCIQLCRIGNYSAGWLLLNEGEMTKKDQGTLDKLDKQLKEIKALLVAEKGSSRKK